MLMVTSGPTATTHGMTPASDWVQRWSHLVPAAGAVLDIACGPGRHMKWFAERGHPVTGVDRAVDGGVTLAPLRPAAPHRHRLPVGIALWRCRGRR